MEIQNKFVELIKQGHKTIEIRKEKEHTNLLFNQSIGNSSFLGNGKIIVNMEVIDYPKCENSICECQTDFIKHKEEYFKLVFDGYQRIKVSELVDKIYFFNLHNYTLDDFKYLNDTFDKLPSYIKENIDWIWINIDWLINDYLKNEEYCIIYNINLEETFNENGWKEK